MTGPGWSLERRDGTVVLTAGTDEQSFEGPAVERLGLERHWFRWFVTIDGQRAVRLKGLQREGAEEVRRALQLARLYPLVNQAINWARERDEALGRARENRRWITTEAEDGLRAARPGQDLRRTLQQAGAAEQLTPQEQQALVTLEDDLGARVTAANEWIVRAELEAERAFFETIESSPLTEEQARAVVCFDNRVQVLAAAGSGKTSVMVARAAYAVKRGFVLPERILLLAFNKAAADELQTRVETRLAAAGIDHRGITASTFHSFGSRLLGEATGRKRRVAPWLTDGRELAVVMEIVDQLRDSDLQFRHRWDLFRTIFARASTELTGAEPDGWSRERKEASFQTMSGLQVRSEGERVVADWLFLNGIDVDYERPYAFDTATAEHSQYRPDFYYPEHDIWHEHWAIGRDGKPPAEFTGYEEGMRWKRSLHAEHGTTLVETTWAGVLWEDDLENLAERLGELGVELDWNPDRTPVNQFVRPLRHEDMARLVRTFMTHVKSNGWDRDTLARRAADSDQAGFRTRLFLDVYWRIHDAWEQRLVAEDSIDFEDMLLDAARHLESGAVTPEYDLVLVDEFQDASRARARMVKALVAPPGRHLLAVGDDWQSINRFAGADVSVMTEFSKWFGRSQQLRLTITFRCTQDICDVASTFVKRNPRQFDKPMRAVTEDNRPVRVVVAESSEDGVAEYLGELDRRVGSGDFPSTGSGRVEVNVLGRYRFDRQSVPSRRYERLDVSFRTIHGSKGLEADVVVITNAVTGTYGFPSTIEDDPVLQLSMPQGDGFPHAEERRLLYVALTRARREVAIVTTAAAISPFVVELLDRDDGKVRRIGEATSEVCPECRAGVLVERTGPYGPFLGCSRFPRCEAKRKVPTDDTALAAEQQATYSGARRCGRCGDGRLVLRRGCYGRFLGCTNYPNCENTARQ